MGEYHNNRGIASISPKGLLTMNDNYSLCDILPGQKAVVVDLKTTGHMRRRLLDIGLTQNTPVECVGKSPFGDPVAYLIRGAVIALRREDSRDIMIDLC